MPPENFETALALLAERQRQQEARHDKIDATLASVADTLKTLTRIESQAQATHSGFTEFRDEMREFRKERLQAERALEAQVDALEALVAKHGSRIEATEETSGWVKKAAGIVVVSVLGGVLALLKLPH
ncbi:hypothetical protein [Aquabacterium sp.]|uniref:hypothetical protein n=1 Tax=Aquabacterium sp. TaxID=1872578 RepID=UPI003BB0131F